MNQNEDKTIQIIGTHNKYLMKQANREINKIPKKRVFMNKYNLTEKEIPYETQFALLKELNLDSKENIKCKEKRFMKQEIERKIGSYKHQDALKNLDQENFIDYNCIITQLLKCNMTCHYCFCQVFILYDNVREKHQWTVDRIDNAKGHTKDNYVISCLECNIKRRAQFFDKFMFTKTLRLVKLSPIPITS
jgi:hypothetical protein